jgi:hypothetical protein
MYASQQQQYQENGQNYNNQNATYAASSAPPPYQQQPMAMSREDRFRAIINRYEITENFSSRLQKLNSFKIVFVFDDSGSMNCVLEESPLNSGLLKATRWDELKYFSRMSIDIANIFNTDGTDVYFLNRPMARNIRNPDDLMPYFNKYGRKKLIFRQFFFLIFLIDFQSPPNGYTPLARVVGTALNNNGPSFIGERKLLLIIVTDGEPTDDSGRSDIPNFKRCLLSRGPSVYTTIVSCTDEDETMRYLNHWDRKIPRLDVVDDYKSERDEIRKAQGRNYTFTFGVSRSIDRKCTAQKGDKFNFILMT